MICDRCGVERTPEACVNCEALDELAALADASMAQAAAEGKHATCRYDPAAIVDFVPGVTDSICGWSGPVADLVNGLCPNGHGGTWLAIHEEGEPAEPLPPRWEWSCAVCQGSGDADHPVEACLLCGAKLHKEGDGA